MIVFKRKMKMYLLNAWLDLMMLPPSLRTVFQDTMNDHTQFRAEVVGYSGQARPQPFEIGWPAKLPRNRTTVRDVCENPGELQAPLSEATMLYSMAAGPHCYTTVIAGPHGNTTPTRTCTHTHARTHGHARTTMRML